MRDLFSCFPNNSHFSWYWQNNANMFISDVATDFATMVNGFTDVL